jgi:hypothetical protein
MASENAPAMPDRFQQAPAKKAVTFPIQKSVRQRNKAHLAFVASQPCLVCQRTPATPII